MFNGARRSHCFSRIFFVLAGLCLPAASWCGRLASASEAGGGASDPREIVDVFSFECAEPDGAREQAAVLTGKVLEHLRRSPNLVLFHLDALTNAGTVQRPAAETVISGVLAPFDGYGGGWHLSLTRRSWKSGETVREVTLYVPDARERWDAVAAVAAKELTEPVESRFAWYLSEADRLLRPVTKDDARHAAGASATLEAAEKLLATRRFLSSATDADMERYERLHAICGKNLVNGVTALSQTLPSSDRESEAILAELHQRLQMLERLYNDRVIPRECAGAFSLWRRRRIDFLLTRERLSVLPRIGGMAREAEVDILKAIDRHALRVGPDQLWNYRLFVDSTRDGGLSLRIYVDNALVAERTGGTGEMAAWLDDWLATRARYWRYLVCDMPGVRVGFRYELRNQDNKPYKPDESNIGHASHEKEYVLSGGERFYIAMEANVPFHPLLLYLKADGDVVQLHPSETVAGRELALLPNPRFPDSRSAEKGVFLTAEPPFGPETIKVFGFMRKIGEIREVSHRALTVRRDGQSREIRVGLGDVELTENDFFTDTIRIRTVPAVR